MFFIYFVYIALQVSLVTSTAPSETKKMMSAHVSPKSIMNKEAHMTRMKKSNGSHGSCITPEKKVHIIQVAPNSSLVFEPKNLTIMLGDTVKWVFVGTRNHTVTQVMNSTICPENSSSNVSQISTSGDSMLSSLFDSGLRTAPSEFQVIPTQVGILDYVCAIPAHCKAGMRGTVHVMSPPSSHKMCQKPILTTSSVMAAPTCPPCHSLTSTMTVTEKITCTSTVTETKTFFYTPTPTPSFVCSNACDCCSSSPGPLLAPPKRHEVKVAPDSNLIFNPKELEIHLGDTVRWVFVGAKNHTVTQVMNANTACPDSPYTSSNNTNGMKMNWFDSGLRTAPSVFDVTPTEMGMLDYICAIPAHCKAGMRGSIRIKARKFVEPSTTSCPCFSCCPSHDSSAPTTTMTASPAPNEMMQQHGSGSTEHGSIEIQPSNNNSVTSDSSTGNPTSLETKQQVELQNESRQTATLTTEVYSSPSMASSGTTSTAALIGTKPTITSQALTSSDVLPKHGSNDRVLMFMSFFSGVFFFLF